MLLSAKLSVVTCVDNEQLVKMTNGILCILEYLA